MDFFGKIKSFFGFPSRNENQPFENRTEQFSHFDQPHRWFHDDETSATNVFSEFDRFFEQQLGEMMKGFNDSFWNFSFDNFSNFGHPAISKQPEEAEETDLRSQYLKPGYDRESSLQGGVKADKDLDGQINIGDLDSIFSGGKSTPKSIIPYEKPKPEVRFFGTSVSTQTIRKPDGSIETHKTVRDNQGNEETTITKRIGDKEYSVIKRRDKNGKEEIEENLVNIDENDISHFKLNDDFSHKPPPNDDGPSFSGFF